VSSKTLAQNVPEKARIAYERGVALHEQGKLEEALIAYGESIQMFPDYVNALQDIGTIYLILNRPDSALIYLNRAHTMDTSNVVVRLAIAVAQMNKQRYAEALKTLDGICGQETRMGLARFYMARIYASQNRHDEAEEALRLALDEDPGLLDGWVMLVNL